ncbi:MAG: hypothetical protein HN786_05050 [Cellvibrionales bacterium]|jgi:hypothetical protein|nr:hypothetical protein [Cellvibrionales bacterium]
MKLIIDSALSEPPSEVSCFRDVTLYAKVYCCEDVLLRCKNGTRSIYWDWLKRHGAHDFISYLLTEDETECGFTISTTKGNLNIPKIHAGNLAFIINSLRSI